MRLNSYVLTIGIALLLCSFPAAGTVSAQAECPNIEVNCTSRMAGDSMPLRCSANVEGDADMKLTYQWSITPSVPLINIPGRPDEVEVNLSNNPNQKITVTLTIGGLPKDCPTAVEYESLPVESDMPKFEPIPMDSPLPTNARSITGTCSESVLEGTAAYFSIKVGDVERDARLTYSWTLTRGKIKSGQGTPSIIVDTTDLGGEIVTATAQVSGLNVPLKVSCTTMITRIPKAYKLAEISSKKPDEESEQLRRFALRLNIGLDEQAYIIATGRRGQSLGEIKRRAERARDYLIDEYGVAPSRIMGIGVAYGNDETIQLWVIQTGAAPPRNPVKIR